MLALLEPLPRCQLRIVEEPDRGRTIPICQQLIALALRGLGVPLDEAESITALAIHELVDAGSPLRSAIENF
jgi:hypothetical protein